MSLSIDARRAVLRAIRRAIVVWAVTLSAAAMASAAPSATWTTQTTPGPSGPPDAALTSVSCLSATVCMAVGSADYGLDSTQVPLGPETSAERWDGSSWTVIPTPVTGPNPELDAVSCASAAFCVAVGENAGNDFKARNARALVEAWNGASWTIRATPAGSVPGSGLSGVSCVSSSFCIAVGAPVSVVGDGSSWRKIKIPSARYHSELSAISCLAATDCTAVGSYSVNKIGVEESRPLAERWDGHSWTIDRSTARGTGPLPRQAVFQLHVAYSSFLPVTILLPGSQRRGTGTAVHRQCRLRHTVERHAMDPSHSGAAEKQPVQRHLVPVEHRLLRGRPVRHRHIPTASHPAATRRELERRELDPHHAPTSPDSADVPQPRCSDLSGISCVLLAGCTAVGSQAQSSDTANLAQSDLGATAAARLNPASEYWRDCGTVKALHVGIEVHHVSCATSRRIVRAYFHGKGVGVEIHRVKGFPRWTCSTGDRSGSCAKGKIASGVPEIAFFYLEASG